MVYPTYINKLKGFRHGQIKLGVRHTDIGWDSFIWHFVHNYILFSKWIITKNPFYFHAK